MCVCVSVSRMALLQLAVHDTVYLLDMLALRLSVPHSQLRTFIRDIFSNNSTLKLGQMTEL